MKGSDFVFNYVDLLYHKCHKINRNHGGSYVDSPYWIRNKKATINLTKKKVNRCFQCAITFLLNHEEIRHYLEIITKIKPFLNKYDWEGIHFPSAKDD